MPYVNFITFALSAVLASDYERQLVVVHKGGVELDDDQWLEALLNGSYHFDDVVQGDLQQLHPHC